MKYQTTRQADKKGIYPVITKSGKKYVVLTASGESGKMSLQAAKKHKAKFKSKSRSKSKSKKMVSISANLGQFEVQGLKSYN